MFPYVLLLAAALAASSPSSRPAAAPILASPCEFDVAHPWTTVECSITLTNTSDDELVVESVAASSPRVDDFTLPVTLAPDGTAELTFDVAMQGRAGNVRDIVTLAVTGPNADAPMNLMIQATGFVYSVLDEPQPALAFGVVDARDREPQEIELTSTDLPDFQIEKIVSTSEFVSATLGADGHRVTMKVREDAPWGLNSGAVVLTTNVQGEPKVQVSVTADVHGRVVPSDNPYAIGVLRNGSKNEVTVQLTSRDDEPFRVGEVTFDRLHGTTRTEPCVPARPGCKLLIWTIGEEQPRGFVSGLMHIDLPEDKQTLAVGFEGMLLSPTTEIRSLNEEAAKQAEARDISSEGASSAVVSGPAFNKALEQAMQNHEPPPAPAGKGPVLRWKVGNQQTLYGYLVYRAGSKEGPFRRVNTEIIRVIDPNSTVSYVWRDTSAEPGKTYWYYISTLANNGQKQQLSGAQKVIAHD